MADQNNLNKPDETSNYSNEVLQTIKGHITRLWTGEYTGMGGLVANMRRWVDVGLGDAKLVKLNADGTESTIFDSSLKTSRTYVDGKISSEIAVINNAISTETLTRSNADQALDLKISKIRQPDGLGMNGEIYVDVTSSRALGVNYTNTKSYPIGLLVVVNLFIPSLNFGYVIVYSQIVAPGRPYGIHINDPSLVTSFSFRELVKA